MPVQLFAAQNPKQLILLIGDGMGPGHIDYYRRVEASFGRATSLDQLLAIGGLHVVAPKPLTGQVIDSAAAASQLSTGRSIASEAIAMADDRSLLTVAQRAKQQGWKVGLISDTRLTHATVASFGAHTEHRSNERAIARQLIDQDFDVLQSGGYGYFLPRKDDQTDLLAKARNQGYRVVTSATQWNQLTQVRDRRLPSKLLSVIGQRQMAPSMVAPSQAEPPLHAMVSLALRMLEDQPFFLMVEAGQIDWAAHNNDPGYLYSEMSSLDQALRTILAYAKGNSNVQVVVTADHETGGFGLSYGTHHSAGSAHADDQPRFDFVSDNALQRVALQKLPYVQILEAMRATTNATQLCTMLGISLGYSLLAADCARIWQWSQNPTYGLDDHFYVYPGQTRVRDFARLLSVYTRTVWSTGTHTSLPVWALMYPQDKNLAQFMTQPQLGQWLNDWIQ